MNSTTPLWRMGAGLRRNRFRRPLPAHDFDGLVAQYVHRCKDLGHVAGLHHGTMSARPSVIDVMIDRAEMKCTALRNISLSSRCEPLAARLIASLI
jgi:hypothetical protein